MPVVAEVAPAPQRVERPVLAVNETVIDAVQVEVALPPLNVSPGALDWSALLPRLNLNGFAKQLALNCVLVDYTEGMAKLMVDEHHRHMLNDRVRGQIEVAMQQHLGGKLKLIIEVGKPVQETPAAIDKRVMESKQQVAQEFLLQDKHIQFMQAEFNATMDPNSIKPVE